MDQMKSSEVKGRPSPLRAESEVTSLVYSQDGQLVSSSISVCLWCESCKGPSCLSDHSGRPPGDGSRGDAVPTSAPLSQLVFPVFPVSVFTVSSWLQAKVVIKKGNRNNGAGALVNVLLLSLLLLRPQRLHWCMLGRSLSVIGSAVNNPLLWH